MDTLLVNNKTVLKPESKIWEPLIFFTGGSLVLAFAPFNYAYLAFVSLGILFLGWEHISATQALLRGYLFGLGLFGAGVSWIYISVHDYGGANEFTSLLITLFFVGIWAIFPALSGYLICKTIPATSQISRLMIMPVIWMIIEYLRGEFVLNGFPWLQVSYSQLETPLSGFIPFIGGYGVGLLITFSVIALILIIKNNRYRITGLCFLLIVWPLGSYLQGKQWTSPSGNPIKVTLIQGNVSQDQKWRPENRDKIIASYLQLTNQHWDSDIIIWPETAIPAFLDQVQESLLQPLAKKAIQNNSVVIVSLPFREPKSKSYNNVVLTVGKHPGIYRKIHLLPFGEYLPFQPLSGYLLDRFNIMPIGSFTPGDNNQPLLQAAGHPFSTSICYEDVFPKLVIKDLPKAAFLVNVTNDGWFGQSIEPHQHMQIAKMRALESGRYLLRATNTGVTGVVATDGKILDQAPLFKKATITSKIIPMKGMTPYAKMRDYPVLTLLGLLLIGTTLWARIEISHLPVNKP